MGKLQIVGVGLATLDILIRLEELPTWSRGSRLKAARLAGGGPVATALVAASRLGARVGYVGTAGEDELAELKLRSLASEGVDTSRVKIRPGPERQVILVCVHAQTGERVFCGLESCHEGPLTGEELDRDYITGADYLHLDGTHGEAALQAARWMREAGKAVVLDAAKTTAAPRHYVPELFRYVDYLICGSGYAPAVTGETDIWAAAEAMLALGPRVVVQTEGKEGSYTVAAEDRFHTLAFDVPVVDTTGAGDVFHGAYLVGLLQGWDLRQVALFASAVSALKCTQLGGRAGIPRLDETLSFLRGRGIACGTHNSFTT